MRSWSIVSAPGVCATSASECAKQDSQPTQDVMQSRRPQLPLSRCRLPFNPPRAGNMSFEIEAFMLYEFIAQHRHEIIRRCQSKVAARSVPPQTQAEMTNGVSLFLDQLADAPFSTGTIFAGKDSRSRKWCMAMAMFVRLSLSWRWKCVRPSARTTFAC